MIKAIIIDDELDARSLLRKLIDNFSEHIEIVGEASNVVGAVKEITEKQPDLVFIDIELPDGRGFDVVDLTLDYDYTKIFVTAYNQYAVTAIKKKAYDYILKPIDPDELQKSLLRIISDYKEEKVQDSPVKVKDMLSIPTLGGYSFHNYSEIVYLEADGSYSCVHFEDGSKKVVSRTLKYFESVVESEDFIRIHASYLINIKKLREYSRSNGGEVLMNNGIWLSVSRSKKEQLGKIFLGET